MKVREKIENRQLRQENVLLKRTLGLSHQFSNIIGRSESMLDVFKMIETVARTNSTILLTGESGTGKGLVAQAIHFHSLRREKPMVSLNCGAMPENLLESELFGHMRGSFTGADANKKGLLEVAETGTVFLDEIGEMSAVMQVKLLRVLQERRFRRVGGLEELQADIRVIAATNQDLTKAVAEGRFREDLFYRINVIPIALPPLRERREDIPLLAEHFLAKYSEQMGKEITGISHEAMELLMRARLARQYPRARERPGTRGGARGDADDSARQPAAQHSGATSHAGPPTAPADALPESGFDLEAHVKEIERELHRGGAEAGRRRAGQGGRAARHELSVVPLLREEIQPAITGSVSRVPLLIVRLGSALALLLVATLYLLASIPFAYYHFLQFPHFWWMPAFIRFHPLVLAAAVAGLVATLRDVPGTLAAVGPLRGDCRRHERAVCMGATVVWPVLATYEIAAALCFLPIVILGMVGGHRSRGASGAAYRLPAAGTTAAA